MGGWEGGVSGLRRGMWVFDSFDHLRVEAKLRPVAPDWRGRGWSPEFRPSIAYEHRLGHRTTVAAQYLTDMVGSNSPLARCLRCGPSP